MMLLFPKKMKYKKFQKQKRRLKSNNFETKYNFPKNFFYGIKLTSKMRVFDYHLETVRLLLRRKMKKNTRKIIFGFFTDLPITKKSTGLRMGKGKGNIVSWTSISNNGRIFCEFTKIFSGVFAKFLNNKVYNKLPVGCKLIYKKKFYNYK